MAKMAIIPAVSNKNPPPAATPGTTNEDRTFRD
jgi:hypothetical protein